MHFDNIRQAFSGMNYQWNSPATYVVFVPGLSLVAKKIQMANLLPITETQSGWENLRQVDAESRKVRSVLRWHYLGSIAQSAACFVAMKVCALPVLSIIGLLAACDLCHTVYVAFSTKATIVDGFYPNGIPEKITIGGAL